eukprot:gene19475-18961_t
MLLLVLLYVGQATSDNGIQCGVASTCFTLNTATVGTADATGKLAFWWNWDTTTKIDWTHIEPSVANDMKQRYTPMIWGTATPSDFSFLKDHEGDVLGFNEPDQYGPACCNCDGQQSYYPATSAGWAPLFNPGAASTAWQKMVGQLTAVPTQKGGIRNIISPAMAQSATPLPGVDCTIDPASPGASPYCHGWLSFFKNFTMKLPCKDLEGATTNCWDVIDAIQIHAYARSAKEVKDKINTYYTTFKDDFEGTNG